MLRTLSGVLLSIVAILGRPFGVGKGSAGKFMFLVAPETTMVASVIGYLRIVVAGSHARQAWLPDRDMGWENQNCAGTVLQAGSIPLGKFESRYGETDAFISPELGSIVWRR